MQQYNFLAVCAVAALIPIIIGFIWYSKALFGNTWMRVNRFTEADMKRGNMAMILGFAYLFSFMLAFVLTSVVIHQLSMGGVVGGRPQPGSPEKAWYDNAISLYGNNFRTFKHGMLHGAISSIFFALPVLGINALFERRGWKYIIIHWGFWLVTLTLMGGVLCQFIRID